jgi:hypothetical protein
MSFEASAYVVSLRKCPDGAPLTCTLKCVLFCLAEHHNRSSRLAVPSNELLISESLTSKQTVIRSIAYLEKHGVLEVIRPDRQGRGKLTGYRFLPLESALELAAELPLKWEPGQPERRVSQWDPSASEQKPKEGSHPGTLSTPVQKHRKGTIETEKGYQKGTTDDILIRKNQESKATIRKGGAKNAPRPPRLPQSERDSLDLRKWRAEMDKIEGQSFAHDPDPDGTWREKAKRAAYLAGVAPARLLELLRQHFPNDKNLDLIYPELQNSATKHKGNGAA